MKLNLILTFLIAVAALTAQAGTKRKPANTPNILCLNAVNEAFHLKWDPVRDQIRTEAANLPENSRRDLHKENRRLLLAKADAIKACNSNAKNISLKKVLAPFK